MDLFGFKKIKKKKHDDFIASLPQRSEDFLLIKLSALRMKDKSNEHTREKLKAIREELDKRGQIGQLGFVFTKCYVKE